MKVISHQGLASNTPPTWISLFFKIFLKSSNFFPEIIFVNTSATFLSVSIHFNSILPSLIACVSPEVISILQWLLSK